MWRGTTSPGTSTSWSGNRPMTFSSDIVAPRHDDSLEPRLARLIGIVVEVWELHDHLEQVDEVEVQRVDVGVSVDERPRDVHGFLPGESHAASSSGCA